MSKAPSFTLEIQLEQWSVGKSEAAHALIRAFEGAAPQRFPDGTLLTPAQMAQATIEMDEAWVRLRAACRMAPFELMAEALIQSDGGIKRHVAKRSGFWTSVAAWGLGLVGSLDWEAIQARSKERIAAELARMSAQGLLEDAQENMQSMKRRLGID
jgi:hypothetical protein